MQHANLQTPFACWPARPTLEGPVGSVIWATGFSSFQECFVASARIAWPCCGARSRMSSTNHVSKVLDR
jgi:hypothetical protein